MTELQIFVPAILSQLAWTVAFVFAAAIAVSFHDTVKNIRRRWGYLGLKPRYAMAYLSHYATRQLNF
ncbi:MAG TPA: hypothetical protein EYQ00_03315 [Dehalococcoidia bacterium]|jgi:hypothetical protein|nr:hypothetical protein [Dehalococcoidia bacterium]